MRSFRTCSQLVVTLRLVLCRRPIGIGLDYSKGSGTDTKWLFFCSKDSDCPSGYACNGAKGLKSSGGVCGALRWSVGAKCLECFSA